MKTDSFKEIIEKIIAGNISGLINVETNNGVPHPSEVARWFTSIPEQKAIDSINTFPRDEQLKLFPYLDLRLQKHLIRNLSHESSAYILNNLTSNYRTIYYSNFKGVELTFFLEFLSPENKTSLFEFLDYPANSVARIINTDFVTIDKGMTIEEARLHLLKFHKDTETANVIYVVDNEGKLIDDVPVRRLILNEPQKKIEAILDGYCTSLKINDSKGSAIQKFKEYDRVVLPVTNEKDILLGVVTIDDVMDVAEQKDTAEIQKFGGIEELDYPYVRTSFFSLLKKRAGWLIILFLGEMLTATAMGYFDKEISKAVVLALFVPLIISSGGNSGSQAATLIIRAMALKELTFKDWWYVIRRELLSGLSLGVILGSIGFIRISLWQHFHWYNYGQYWLLVATTIFLSLIGIVMWGTLTGSMIPMILKRLKIDPATSSAPFVATLVDVTGLIIYFSIAALLLKGTLL